MHLLFNMFRVTQPSVVLLSHVTRSLYMLRTFRCHQCFMYYSTGLLSSLRNQGNVHLCVHLSKTVSSVAELHTVQVSLFSLIFFFLLHLTSKEMTYKWKIDIKNKCFNSSSQVHKLSLRVKGIPCWRWSGLHRRPWVSFHGNIFNNTLSPAGHKVVSVV